MNYRVVIIGAGKVAAFFDNPQHNKILTHAHAILTNKYMELVGFYDIDLRRAQQAAEIWKTKAFVSFNDAMCSSDIVFVCVPDQFHYDVLLQIANYNPTLGVAEKPFTSTIDEARKLKNCFQSKCIPLILNYTRRFVPEFQILKKECKQYGKFLKGTGYYGKGILHNGSHMIDVISFLLSEDITVEKVSHNINDFFKDDKSADITLHVADGFFQMIAIDCHVASVFEFDLFFEKKRIRILDTGKIIEKYTLKESKEFEGYTNYVLENIIYTSWSPVVKELTDSCINYLENHGEILCGIDDGIRVLEINSQIKELVDE